MITVASVVQTIQAESMQIGLAQSNWEDWFKLIKQTGFNDTILKSYEDVINLFYDNNLLDYVGLPKNWIGTDEQFKLLFMSAWMLTAVEAT